MEDTQKKPIKETIVKYLKDEIVQNVIIAFLFNLVIDIVNQRSLGIALARLFTNPLTVFYNFLIIFITISIGALFKRRIFATLICSLPWIVIVVTNFVVQCFRQTPVSAIDFTLIFSVFYMIDTYLTIPQIILIVLAIIGAIVGLVFLYLKAKIFVPKVKKVLISLASGAGLLFICTFLFLKLGVISNDYSNLTKAYHDYGLPYCFIVSVVDRGIPEPETYNKEVIENIIDEVESYPDFIVNTDYKIGSKNQPNIIFLQLESFIDANKLLGVNYSTVPTPYFNYLKVNYPSGYLKVPTFGAGTINTEFEVITGMNIDDFGTGEYPYKTVLTGEGTCETISNLLRDYGYYSTVMHNNTATFYDRNLVFSNIGFDRFVSSEFMGNTEYTPVGWLKDNCLIYEIDKALKASEAQDLIYAISVQPHGKYPEEMEAVKDSLITVTFEEEPAEEVLAAYTYYINQLYEVDCYLKELTEQLEQYDEPVMLVVYGDHLPNFELEAEDVATNDLYLTEYVLWTNYDLDVEDLDLTSYQLSSYVLGCVGFDDGIFVKLHQTRNHNPNYLEDLESLEYDTFFGEMYLWNEVKKYQKSDLMLGYNEIEITEVYKENEGYFVKGTGFTDSSAVYINNVRIRKTICYDDNTLFVKVDEIKDGDVVVVKQITEAVEVLYTSEKYIYLDTQ